MLDITKGGKVKQGSQQNGSHSELDTHITCLCMDFLFENIGQYPCFVTVPIRVLTQTSQLLNIQLFLMFEFLGTHGHLLHTWHVPKYSLHSYNSPQTLFPIASLYADVVF